MQSEKPPIQLEMDWKEHLLFESATANGRRLSLDGDSRAALSPMETLLGSLVGCMAIDVVTILRKMRAEPRSLKVAARGARRDQPPRHFTEIHLKFVVGGDAAPEKVERAIQLSFDKYCSVFHSLRSDLQVEHEVVFRPAGQSSAVVELDPTAPES